ncbi:hypothetical protein TNCV_3277471 [Trichonephila clavipes]|nr:hypothetical protein TNCV_3277471 [Trichonephila clavipes]
MTERNTLSEVGFEPTPTASGLRPERSALDRSAILTRKIAFPCIKFFNQKITERNTLSEVGFEPTPTQVDYDLNAAP